MLEALSPAGLSADEFLRRYWQKRPLIDDAPLRILRRFRPSREWLLQPDDMLYLPPRCAHDGVAVFINGEACSASASAARLLTRLADRRHLPPGMKIDRESAQWLYQWYRAGYIELSGGE